MAHQAQYEFAESLWSRLKAELLEGGAFLNMEDAHTEIFDYIETVRRCGLL